MPDVDRPVPGRVLVVIPTYNEADNIVRIVPKVLAQEEGVHVLVVDDNSPDGTAKFVRQMAEQDRRVHLLERPGKMGLGTAYVAGFKYALAREYEFVFEMDADFSHNPKEIPNFLKAARDADLVLGSRYVKGGGVENWGLTRKVISRGGCLYAQCILALPYRDLTGGFKCFRRRVLEAIDLDSIGTAGYGFQIEMTYRAYKLGFTVVELPIIFVDRKVGESKMSNDIVVEAMKNVWKLRFSRPPARRPA